MLVQLKLRSVTLIRSTAANVIDMGGGGESHPHSMSLCFFFGVIMGFKPEGSTKYRVLGIDPGTTTCGFSILEYDIITLEATVLHSETIKTTKLDGYHEEKISQLGDRYARLRALENELLLVMKEYRVNGVISESPYMSRRPQAYAALVECIYAISNAVLRYSAEMGLETVTPSEAKKCVGVPGNSGDKEAIRKALQKEIDTGRLVCNIDLNTLDEHSTDSIAVNYSKVQNWREWNAS